MIIEKVTEVTDELVAAFERLIPQLSSSNPPPTPGRNQRDGDVASDRIAHRPRSEPQQ